MPDHEPFLRADELADTFNQAGFRGRCRTRWTTWSARALIRAMRSGGAPVACRYTVRATDAAAWIAANPGWRVRGRPAQPSHANQS